MISKPAGMIPRNTLAEDERNEIMFAYENRECIMILMRMYELMFMANCDNMLIDDAIMLIERICNMLNDGHPMEYAIQYALMRTSS